MGLKEGGVVDDEGQEHRERPQQEGWEELGNDWILCRTAKRLINETEAAENELLKSRSF